MEIFKIIKKNITIVIIILGSLLRIIFGLGAEPLSFQHDVNNISHGHLDYAVHFFRNFSLPNNNLYEFHQPPLNAIIQGLFMRFISIFDRPSKSIMKAFNEFMNSNMFAYDIKNKILWKYIIRLYSYNKILTVIYSILILILIYKILKIILLTYNRDSFNEKNNSNISGNVILSICAFYPGMIMNATQYGNDSLSYLFFFLSLYLGLKWFIRCENYCDHDMQGKFSLVPLAISIGFGMMTKISVAAIAFVLAPLMLYRLIVVPHDKKNTVLSYRKNVFIQLLIFALIVFPLGLWYPIRNLILFNQPIGYVPNIAEGTIIEINTNMYGVVDRFLSFPISRLVTKNYFIFHDMTEYNVWIDLIKTATFDEFYLKDGFIAFRVIIYVLNILFFVLGFIATLFIIIISVNKLVAKITSKSNLNSVYDSSIHTKYYLCNYLGIMLVVVALAVYLKFNIEHQFSCNSNYRYIMYITLGMSINIINFLRHIFIKGIY